MSNQNTVTRAECFEWTQFTNGPLLSREDAKRLARAHLELLDKVNKTWRCFHCGFETCDPAEAEAHFGERDDPEEFTPTCTWWSKLTREERAQEIQDLQRQFTAEQDENGTLRIKIEGLEYRLVEARRVLGIVAPYHEDCYCNDDDGLSGKCVHCVIIDAAAALRAKPEAAP